MLFGSTISADTIVFQESFDAQDDWVCEDGNVNPQSEPPNWSYVYAQELWHPDNTPGSTPACQISGADTDQVFDGTGKAYVTDVESVAGSGFGGSDGLLFKDLPEADEYYYEVQIKFGPNFHTAGVDPEADRKLMRIAHWNGIVERQKNFATGGNGPMVFFNWKRNTGAAPWMTAKHSFRGPPFNTASYKIDDTGGADISDAPGGLSGNGDMSIGFYVTETTRPLDQTNLPNQIPATGGSDITHEMVYGDVWHRLGVYVKLNSAAGVLDGLYKFWFDDILLVDIKQIAWCPTGYDPADYKWNIMELGGNSDYHWDASDTWIAGRERWISYDDLKIYSTIPVRLQI